MATLLALSVGFRLPAMLNAAGTQADAAVVGLQARHLLRGEWSFFLWGSGYQTSVDSAVAALLFWFGGATPLLLMLSAFLGYLVLTLLVYATLCRRFSAWQALLLVTPLVFTPGPVHTYALYPPRQTALTLLFLGIWLLDGAAEARRPRVWLALGALTAGLSSFADPYCLLFLPAVALFAALAAEADADSDRLGRGLVVLAGGVLGVIPTWLLTHSSGAAHGVYGFSRAVIGHNFELLHETCLPFLLSTKVFYSPHMLASELWQPPRWFALVQHIGASAFVLGIIFGAISVFRQRTPDALRRLAALATATFILTLAAFLSSVMVMELHSARYLVAILLVAPFALAPALSALGSPRFAAALCPYLLSAAVGGWLHYGSDVDGARIVRDNGNATDEHALAAALRERGIHYGVADYWVSYRLTFLFGEEPVIVPWHESQDRYPPYRAAYAKARRVAYIYDPLRSLEDFSERVRELGAKTVEFSGVTETLSIGRYRVLVLDRRAP